MGNLFHSVQLDTDKCKGCIHCIKRCPTEAIRVRNGKAHILADRCIDCGECIRVCPHHAKRPLYDPLSVMGQFAYTIALPAPSLYGQFHRLDDIEIVLNALLVLGFDEVADVGAAAELISEQSRAMIATGTLKTPIISNACPAVTRLIQVRFPSLIDHLLPICAPVDLAATRAKQAAAEKTGLPIEKIGAIFISPCVAKNTATKHPIGLEKSPVDAVVAIKDIYPRLLPLMRDVQDAGLEEIPAGGRIGIGWASSGGEAAGTLTEHYLAADGPENVIKVLEDLEDEKFPDLEFVELNMCSGGCVGGVLTVENPYVARARLKHLRQYRPVSTFHGDDALAEQAAWNAPVEYIPAMKLADTMKEAMQKLSEINRITAQLPGLDCGSCGAPTCRALAEDIVLKYANENACTVRMREQFERMAAEQESENV